MVFKLTGKIAGKVIKEVDKSKKKSSIAESGPININLQDEINYLKQFDFKDENFKFLTVRSWMKDPYSPTSATDDVLAKLRWYELEAFQFSILPIIPKPTFGNVCLRILTNSRLNFPMSYTIYAEDGVDTLLPSTLNRNVQNTIDAFPNRVYMKDISISCRGFLGNKYFSMILGFGGHVIKRVIRVTFGEKNKKVKTYEELKERRFFDLVDLPYLTPEGSRKVIQANKTCNFRFKLKNKDADKLRLENLSEPDTEWISDYTNLSEYWE